MTEPTATVESSHHAFQVDANANVVLDSECGDLPLSPPLPLLPQHSAATKDGIADTGPRVPTPAYRVRPMQLSDVNAVLDLWKTYELYEGKHTIQTFMALDPQGFWVAEEQQTGTCTLYTSHSPLFPSKH